MIELSLFLSNYEFKKRLVQYVCVNHLKRKMINYRYEFASYIYKVSLYIQFFNGMLNSSSSPLSHRILYVSVVLKSSDR